MRTALATACWLLALAAPVPSQRAITVGGEPSVEAIVADAARYVREYEQALTYLVADEHYRQQIRGQVPLVKAMPRTRAMKSEIFFMFALDNRDWMAIRDVAELDGRPIDGRPDSGPHCSCCRRHRSPARSNPTTRATTSGGSRATSTSRR